MAAVAAGGKACVIPCILNLEVARCFFLLRAELFEKFASSEFAKAGR